MNIVNRGFDNVRRQTILWTNAEKWSIGPMEAEFSEILIKIY